MSLKILDRLLGLVALSFLFSLTGCTVPPSEAAQPSNQVYAPLMVNHVVGDDFSAWPSHITTLWGQGSLVVEAEHMRGDQLVVSCICRHDDEFRVYAVQQDGSFQLLASGPEMTGGPRFVEVGADTIYFSVSAHSSETGAPLLWSLHDPNRVLDGS